MKVVNNQQIDRLLELHEKKAFSEKDKRVRRFLHWVVGLRPAFDKQLKKTGISREEYHRSLEKILYTPAADKSLRNRVIKLVGSRDYSFCSGQRKSQLIGRYGTENNKLMSNRERFGGKGMFLQKMLDAGLPVPPFCTIDLSLLQSFTQHPVDAKLIRKYIPKLIDGADCLSLEDITEKISTFPVYQTTERSQWLTGLGKLIVSDEFNDAIKTLPDAELITDLYSDLLERHPGEAIIARSSGIHEDNYGDAQAGKFESYVQGQSQF
ncbi:PEP/pyruvate-binding domain-containing protein [Endozoicomonas ascidiicola]|uniref:PEP/pyruvate-binding domain-containing protein n=1 Tax=Endozoicomonas ascidiicola TaxID=1698521 RepID=UPI000834E44A|nr:PEP/pyruvate-binding domain-containing protein [Endozoicomonas ascidiicola]